MKKNQTDHIVSNEAVRGKPFLDIDRVLTENRNEKKQLKK
ncbi:hypothetical protein BkAM31D_25060 [Halalkalibacter krulwichiae]|uniref:Uncharacterized protein n=1 Tax=Halalkalibacter krulwichiae TaxID=199441 RepID=A0A1X9MLQ1_9BACI|nr:hypothetical protein BkAM31D_25060 [Halalkalibacter krulwichiae]